jgi:hypothetical protein
MAFLVAPTIIILIALCSLIPSEIIPIITDPTTLAMAAAIPAIRPREPIVVYTLDEWCKMRKVSKATAKRLIAAGKIKATHLSERRVVIRSDHDQEFLDRCSAE